jgi:hypothetical protein
MKKESLIVLVITPPLQVHRFNLRLSAAVGASLQSSPQSGFKPTEY